MNRDYEYFYLVGQMPSGKNAVVVTRTGHRFPKKRFVDWREDAFRQLEKQHIPKDLPFEGPCIVEVGYTAGDRRRRDVPGMIDALCHLMERYGLVKDDAQFIEWHWAQIEGDEAGVRVNVIAREPVDPAPRQRDTKPRSRSRSGGGRPKNKSCSSSPPKE